MPGTATKQRRLTKTQVTEVSGVDFPAHLHNGWILKKNIQPEAAQRVLAALGRSTVPTISTGAAIGMLKSLSKEQRATITDAESVKKALTDEQSEAFRKDAGLADLQPVADALAQAWSQVRDLIEREDPDIPTIAADGTVIADAPVESAVAPVAAAPAPAVAALASPQLLKALETMDPASAEIVKALVKDSADKDEAIRKERDLRLDEAATTAFEKAHGALGLTASEVAPALRRFEAIDPTGAAAIRKALTETQTVKQASQKLVTKELGHTFSAPEAGSPADQIETIAKGLFDAKAPGAPTIEQARSLAMTQNPALYEALRNPTKEA